MFPAGCLCLKAEAATDFDKRGQGDDQLRDKETGERVWLVKVLDLDPDGGKFGAPTEIKVKLVAPVQPVPPASAVPGYPPAVEFSNVTLTPYVDSQRSYQVCLGHPHGRQVGSVRADAMGENLAGVLAGLLVVSCERYASMA